MNPFSTLLPCPSMATSHGLQSSFFLAVQPLEFVQLLEAVVQDRRFKKTTPQNAFSNFSRIKSSAESTDSSD